MMIALRRVSFSLLTANANTMNQPTGTERDREQAQLLLEEYSFDLSRFSANQLVAIWQQRLGMDPSWIRAAVLEALYLGRYKAFSVEQILQGWKRRGYPVRHFNSEFERVVFSPIDPTLSKYAPMTTSSSAPPPPSPSESPTAADSDGEVATAEKPASSATDSPATATFETVETAAKPDAAAPKMTLPTASVNVTEPAIASQHCLSEDAPLTAASLFNQPEPIQKFTPESQASEFYERLQAVARQSQ
ncbi:MAG: hypothetical protein ACFB0E_03005 [Leptolyngbyaceae cyanobacterium]